MLAQQHEVADDAFCEPIALDVQPDLDVSLLPCFGKVRRGDKNFRFIHDNTFGMQGGSHFLLIGNGPGVVIDFRQSSTAPRRDESATPRSVPEVRKD